MSEKPLILQGWGVRAVFADLKSQTRRVVKPQPPFYGDEAAPSSSVPGTWNFWMSARPRSSLRNLSLRCPYGQPGDVLWVRETLKATYEWPGDIDESGEEVPHFGVESAVFQVWHYAADGAKLADWPIEWEPERDTVASIHMPRWAARLFLRVERVRVERVQEISEESAQAEGVTFLGECLQIAKERFAKYGMPQDPGWIYRLAFAELWDTLNAKRGYGWSENPWVWIVEFERCEEPHADA